MENTHLETGDILLFQSNFSGIFGWWGWIVSTVTRSKWTHVALILNSPTYIDPSYTGVHVLESGWETWDTHIGTLINPIEKILNDPTHKVVALRRLQQNISDLDGKMSTVYTTVKDKTYDMNIIELIGNELKSPLLADGRELDKFVCSSLVGYVYTALGLLDRETQWFYMQPWHFSEQNPKLKLINAALGNEKIIGCVNP